MLGDELSISLIQMLANHTAGLIHYGSCGNFEPFGECNHAAVIFGNLDAEERSDCSRSAAGGRAVEWLLGR